MGVGSEAIRILELQRSAGTNQAAAYVLLIAVVALVGVLIGVLAKCLRRSVELKAKAAEAAIEADKKDRDAKRRHDDEVAKSQQALMDAAIEGMRKVAGNPRGVNGETRGMIDDLDTRLRKVEGRVGDIAASIDRIGVVMVRLEEHVASSPHELAASQYGTCALQQEAQRSIAGAPAEG